MDNESSVNKVTDTNHQQLRSEKLVLDVSRNRILFLESEVELPAKAVQVLFHLMNHPQQTVTREQLIEKIWNGNMFVGEKSLTHAVWQLRKALKDPSESSTYIETIPKQGYRFLLPVEIISNEPTTHIFKRPNIAIISILTLLTIITIFWLSIKQTLPPQLPTEHSPTIRLQPNATMLTSYPGVESSPSVSADGKRLVFQWQKPGLNSDIYLLELNAPQSTPKAITQTPYVETSPDWSPDGKRIAFIRRVGTSGCSVFIRSLISEEEHLIDDCAGGYFYSLSWSPDGEYLAYSYYNSAQRVSGIVALHLASRERIYVSEKKGDGYFVDANPCWSTDSKTLAFTRLSTPSQFDIVVTDLNKQTIAVKEKAGIINGCSFDATGENIIYAVGDGDSTLMSLNLLTGIALPIANPTANILNFHYPKVIGDNKQIVFSTYKTELNIAQIEIDQDSLDTNLSNSTIIEKKQPTTTEINVSSFIQSIGFDYQGQYSPDGRQIIFESTRDGRHGIWLSNSDGTNPRRIESISAFLSFPAWSPDGEKLVMVGRVPETNSDQIFVYDFVTDKTRQISKGKNNHAPPSWSADGKSVYAGRNHNGQWNIWRYDVNGNSDEQVTQLGALYAQPIPDTQDIILFNPQKGGLWKFSAETRQQEYLTASLNSQNWAAWDIDGQFIYYLEIEHENTLLKRYSLTTENEIIVAKLTNYKLPHWSRISVTNNQKFLLSNRAIFEEDMAIIDIAE